MNERLLAAWLMFSLVACDGFGEPIVDQTSRGDTPGRTCIEPTVDCSRNYVSQAPYQTPALPQLPCPRGNTEPASCDPLSKFQSSCALTVRVVEGLPAGLSNQSCVSLDMSPAPGSDELEVAPLEVRGGTLTLHAVEPTTFVFSGVQLTLSQLRLAGPITLEFTNQSALLGVSIQSDDAVQVTLRESTLRDGVIALPGGSFRALRATIDNSDLRAREVTLETTELDKLKVTSERVVGIELKGDGLQLDVVDASFSELEVSRLTLDRCGTALFVNARLVAPTFEPCTVGKLQTDSSAISGGVLRGPVESRGTVWRESLFGAGSGPTELLTWGASLDGNVICRGLQRLTIADPVTLSCNDCRALPAPESSFCSAQFPDAGVLEDAGVNYAQRQNPLCPALDAVLPMCSPNPENRAPF